MFVLSIGSVEDRYVQALVELDSDLETRMRTCDMYDLVRYDPFGNYKSFLLHEEWIESYELGDPFAADQAHNYEPYSPYHRLYPAKNFVQCDPKKYRL